MSVHASGLWAEMTFSLSVRETLCRRLRPAGYWFISVYLDRNRTCFAWSALVITVKLRRVMACRLGRDRAKLRRRARPPPAVVKSRQELAQAYSGQVPWEDWRTIPTSVEKEPQDVSSYSVSRYKVGLVRNCFSAGVCRPRAMLLSSL